VKILITGGAGFIGSQVGNLLSKEHTVVSLDNLSYGKKENLLNDGKPFSDFVFCDVTDPDFEKYCIDVDVVIHLAGIAPLPESQINPIKAYQNNLMGTINVIQACRKHNVKKIIFSSTSAVYENSETFPLKEDSYFKDPDLIYSMSKMASEKVCLSYCKNYDMDITILRFFNVYGINQDHTRKQPPLLGYIIKCLLNNESPTFYSDGSQSRDYIYVDDIYRLILCCIENKKSKGQIFNVCSGESYTVKEIYDIFRKNFNTDLECFFEQSENFWDKYPDLFEGFYSFSRKRIKKEVNKYSLGCYDKAKSLLGWEPQISLEQGIEKIIKEVK